MIKLNNIRAGFLRFLWFDSIRAEIYGNVVTSATRYYTIFKCYAKTQKTTGKPKHKFIMLTFIA